MDSLFVRNVFGEAIELCVGDKFSARIGNHKPVVYQYLGKMNLRCGTVNYLRNETQDCYQEVTDSWFDGLFVDISHV